MAVFLATLAAGTATSAAAAGGTAAAAGAVGATGAAAASAGAGISAASVLSGAFTAFSALSTVAMGLSGYQAAKAQADQMELQAEQETIQGLQRANEIRRQYLQTVSSQRVAYAASGIDLSSGTVGAVEAGAREVKERQLAVDATDTGLARLASRARAGQARNRANLALLDAGVRAGGIAVGALT